MDEKKYKVDFQRYTAPGNCRPIADDITFINQGATPITINNAVIIAPGASLRISNDGDGSKNQSVYRFTGTNIDLVIVERTRQ